MLSKISILIPLCFSAYLQAETIPKPTRFDNRTRIAYYNPNEVYNITGQIGYVVHIIFEEDETIKLKAIGDPDAWEVEEVGNHLFLRPLTANNAKSNLSIITNRRDYSFVLDVDPYKAKADYKNQQFRIEFKYLASNNKKKKEEEEKKKIKDSLRNANNLIINTKYFGCGDEEILPVAIYDNGQHLYMKFSDAQEIPAVYFLNSKGEESLLNFSVRNDWFVIDRVTKSYMLRHGNYVACIENHNNVNIRSETGTLSGDVHREIKGTKKND